MSRPLRLVASAASLIVVAVLVGAIGVPRSASAAGEGNPFNQLFQEHSLILKQLNNALTQLGIIRAALKADLQPLPVEGSDPPDYCNLAPNGDLIVRVANHGFVAVGSSPTQVVFQTTGGGSLRVDGEAGPVQSGEVGEASFSIPAGCFSPGCFFWIIVDPGSVVPEQNNSNNSAKGFCLG